MIQIIISIIYGILLKLPIFHSRMVLPGYSINEAGKEVFETHTSIVSQCAIERMNQPIILYIEYFLLGISIITSLLFYWNQDSILLKRIKLISFILSTLGFIFILIYAKAQSIHF